MSKYEEKYIMYIGSKSYYPNLDNNSEKIVCLDDIFFYKYLL